MKIGSKEYIDHVDNLNIFKKLEVYMYYHITMISMKFDFHMVRNIAADSKEHSPIIEFTGEKRYLWTDTNVLSFDDFISNERLGINHYPKDFEVQEYAGEPWYSMNGIYDWYWKYKDKLKQGLNDVYEQAVN